MPFRPRGPRPPLEMLHQAGIENFYWFYFQKPGVAEAEFERDIRVRTYCRRLDRRVGGLR